jgi:hypothetical protein
MGEAALVMRQVSAWHAFRHDFLTPHGQRIGGFEHADFAQANNARLKLHGPGSSAGQIHVELQGESFRVQHEYIRRGHRPDIRYLLVGGVAGEGDGTPLATFDFHHVQGQRWPRLLLTAGDRKLMASVGGHLFKRRYEWRDAAGGAILGVVRDAPGLQLRRSLIIDGTALSLPVKALLGVVFSSYRP